MKIGNTKKGLRKEDLNKIKANLWQIKGHHRKSNEMLLSNYYTIVQGPPQMHQPVARRPITGSVGNYYPQVKLFPSHFFLFVSYLLGNVNHM